MMPVYHAEFAAPQALRTDATVAGYLYATAETVAHVDFTAIISPSHFTSPYPPTALKYGNRGSKRVLIGMSIGVDQANTGPGLAA